MTSQKLKQIDQRLVELLQERISLTGEFQPAALQSQIADLTSVFKGLGIPELVWEQVVTGCLQESLPATTDVAVQTRRVTVIGGGGRMGKLFVEQLSAAGHEVTSLGRHDWDKAEQLLEAELVLVSVPIAQTVDIIRRAAPYLAATTALADITSIKSEPVAAMLACHRGPVMGLHPMFGPSKGGFSGQKIVVCPGRDYDRFQWLLDFMSAQGGELIFCEPQEHDRTMAIVQAVRHFSQFGFGVFLKTEQVDLERSLTMSSPNYRQELEALGRFFAQNPSMYVDIMLANDTSRQTIKRLANYYQQLAELIDQKDRKALMEAFAKTETLFHRSNGRLQSNQNQTPSAISTAHT